MRFFVGLDRPWEAKHFAAAFISVNTLRGRKKAIEPAEWIMDSGAFSEILQHGRYRFPVEEYAFEINRWKGCGTLLAAVSQDYMCEPAMLAKTGLTVADHQRLTIERYDALVGLVTDVYVMPVLQGYSSKEYVECLRAYGDRIGPGAWVGVGSVCKRNSNPAAIWRVLDAIKAERPDLRLHGFGVKTTALKSRIISDLLYSADSMAWSFAARKQGRNNHDWREAKAFAENIASFVDGFLPELFQTEATTA